MANDWTKPVTTDTFANVLSIIRGMFASALKRDFTGDTNIPTGSIRWDNTNKVEERYNGSTWDEIIRPVPVGSIQMGFWAAAPNGYLLLQGGTIGSATSGGTVWASALASNLFSYLWDNLADAQAPVSGGRGASAAADFAANKTITLPDFRQRFPLGKAASGTGAIIGGVGGAIDHVHTGPSHTHTIADHNHTIPDHNHSIAGHWHSATGNGASINITTGGLHGHDINTITPTVGGSSRIANSHNSGTSSVNTTAILDETHTHPNGEFSGKVGKVTGGSDGDAGFNTGNKTGFSTNNKTGMITDSGGTGNTGSENPAFLAVNYIIKY